MICFYNCSLRERIRIGLLEKSAESETILLSSGVRRYLLKGYTDSLPVIQSRIIRIFISSGFHGNISSAFRTRVSAVAEKPPRDAPF